MSINFTSAICLTEADFLACYKLIVDISAQRLTESIEVEQCSRDLEKAFSCQKSLMFTCKMTVIAAPYQGLFEVITKTRNTLNSTYAAARVFGIPGHGTDKVSIDRLKGAALSFKNLNSCIEPADDHFYSLAPSSPKEVTSNNSCAGDSDDIFNENAVPPKVKTRGRISRRPLKLRGYYVNL